MKEGPGWTAELRKGGGPRPQKPRAAQQQGSLEKVLGRGSAWKWPTQVAQGGPVGRVRVAKRSWEEVSTGVPISFH